jgi:hypothetical protein
LAVSSNLTGGAKYLSNNNKNPIITMGFLFYTRVPDPHPSNIILCSEQIKKLFFKIASKIFSL